ncbi:ERF family protein [Campylobacter sp. RM16192]|uniref:ERF family protein n=1 Tax=Campylobacter sp. RM16192 TaxID=1660080 RepID=UPI0014516DEE|nr:ERF family protein [Campylobacter sp. RM16192]QCD52835.1 DNA single-strand annealing protein, ERF superfamily [Campylobacter sp. RM16192]
MISTLSKIQCELKAPRGQFNKFGGYAYRSCEDILEALKTLLEKYEAVVTVSDEIVNIGNRFYVKATATIKTKDGETSVTAYAREADTKKGMDEAQITGAASSYARKYALNGLFAIDDTKDADATNTHDKDEPKQEVKQPNTNKRPELTIEQLNDLSGLIEATNTNMGEFLSYFKAYELRFVPYDKAKGMLLKKLDGMKKAG